MCRIVLRMPLFIITICRLRVFSEKASTPVSGFAGTAGDQRTHSCHYSPLLLAEDFLSALPGLSGLRHFLHKRTDLCKQGSDGFPFGYRQVQIHSMIQQHFLLPSNLLLPAEICQGTLLCNYNLFFQRECEYSGR